MLMHALPSCYPLVLLSPLSGMTGAFLEFSTLIYSLTLLLYCQSTRCCLNAVLCTQPERTSLLRRAHLADEEADELSSYKRGQVEANALD